MGNLDQIVYLVAAALFILSAAGLSNQETARRGNRFGIAGMAVAILITLFAPEVQNYGWIFVSGTIGAGIGALLATRVAMTGMPELVAMLNAFVGLAAVLVGFSTALAPGHTPTGIEALIHDVEIYTDIGIGSLTFVGSMVAWAKLSGRVSGQPMLLPNRHLVNLGLISATLLMLLPYPSMAPGSFSLVLLMVMTVVTGVLGAHLVLAIGGADMPVVVSLLNSYSGWTAAAAGFMLRNDLLIVTGALVGSSGAILSYIMCEAMNRSLWNVVFGGFGTGDAPAGGSGEAIEGEIVTTDVAEVASELREAHQVIIVPGYGMAVAQAQHAVREVTQILRERGQTVRFAIHPVAGRLPGHMNVLLAEAGVPYDIVFEMDEINEDFGTTDVVLVIGANDTVNMSALDDPSSPIYGMPIIECFHARRTVVLKRSMNMGYAGVANPLFFHENTRMLFGDAKDTLQQLAAALR